MLVISSIVFDTAALVHGDCPGKELCITVATVFHWHHHLAEVLIRERMSVWLRRTSSTRGSPVSSSPCSTEHCADSAALLERLERLQKTALRVAVGEASKGTNLLARLMEQESINGTDLISRLQRLEKELTVLKGQVVVDRRSNDRKPSINSARDACSHMINHTNLMQATSINAPGARILMFR